VLDPEGKPADDEFFCQINRGVGLEMRMHHQPARVKHFQIRQNIDDIPFRNGKSGTGFEELILKYIIGC